MKLERNWSAGISRVQPYPTVPPPKTYRQKNEILTALPRICSQKKDQYLPNGLIGPSLKARGNVLNLLHLITSRLALFINLLLPSINNK